MVTHTRLTQGEANKISQHCQASESYQRKETVGQCGYDQVEMHCMRTCNWPRMKERYPTETQTMISVRPTCHSACGSGCFQHTELAELESKCASSRAYQNVGSSFPTAGTGGRPRSVLFRSRGVGKPSLCRLCGCPVGSQTPRCRAECKLV